MAEDSQTDTASQEHQQPPTTNKPGEADAATTADTSSVAEKEPSAEEHNTDRRPRKRWKAIYGKTLLCKSCY